MGKPITVKQVGDAFVLADEDTGAESQFDVSNELARQADNKQRRFRRIREALAVVEGDPDGVQAIIAQREADARASQERIEAHRRAAKSIEKDLPGRKARVLADYQRLWQQSLEAAAEAHARAQLEYENGVGAPIAYGLHFEAVLNRFRTVTA